MAVEGAPRSRRDRALADRDAEVQAAAPIIGTAIDVPLMLAAWEASLRAGQRAGPRVWTHSDLLRPNLLAEDSHLTGVVDFGDMGVGDPAVDGIPAWTVLSHHHREAFFAGLPDERNTWLRARGMALHQALMDSPAVGVVQLLWSPRKGCMDEFDHSRDG